MKTRNVARYIHAFGASLLLATYSPALADEGQGKSFPPVEHASFHQLIFEDEDVAVLNNAYRPGGDSGFHAHYRDLFAVIIQPSESSGQALGKPLVPAPEYAVGDAFYSPVGGERRVHRIVNGDKGRFQIMVVELRRAAPSGNANASRDAAPQYVPIADNPRLRAWRLVLQPGQSVPAILQADKGVRVVVRGGLLTTTTAGFPDQTLALRAGDFAIQQPGTQRALTNSGTETIELVEMELK
jgi:quercetin dioxygenase-like cupin family protein